jgi:putative redox protein
MQASVTWEDGLTFKGTADSGFIVDLGGDPAVGGADDGFRPLELMLVSLAGCTGMDVISILRKKRQQVTDFKVAVEADRAGEHPKVFTAVRVHYTITGTDVDPKAVERAIELSETKYCPAQAMLVEAVPIKHTYEIRAPTADR